MRSSAVIVQVIKTRLTANGKNSQKEKDFKAGVTILYQLPPQHKLSQLLKHNTNFLKNN